MELEKEIANAPLHDHDVVIADLKQRKLIIAEGIEHHRRLVQRFSDLTNVLNELH